jgi:aprataxin
MTDLNILRTYAQAVPHSLPASILFHHSPKNITIFDAFPKSTFHFLVLPRVQGTHLDAATLSSLQSLLKGDKKQAKEVITALAEDAMAVKKDIQDEMVHRHGFKWDVWIGFHGAPSMACVFLLWHSVMRCVYRDFLTCGARQSPPSARPFRRPVLREVKD